MSGRRAAASGAMGASPSAAWPPRVASRFFTSSRFATTNRRSSMGRRFKRVAVFTATRSDCVTAQPPPAAVVSPRFFPRQSLRVLAVDSSASDAELLEAFRAGDVKAFESLVRRYQRPVLSIARRFSRDPDDAEDLAQRAFINAADRAAGWRGGAVNALVLPTVVQPAK